MNLKRFNGLCDKAENIGAKLTESGAPRGERRMYHIEFKGGRKYEHSLLSFIENELSIEASKI